MFGHSHPSVDVDGFSGPFDLLLRLIERRELDIMAISLAEVTEQYLQSLSERRLRDPEHLSAFLVVAAKLLYIKSSLLLPARPRPPSHDDESLVDPTDLTQRLTLYRAFRGVAEALGARHAAGLRSYSHLPVTYSPSRARPVQVLDPACLRDALFQALTRVRTPTEHVLSENPRLSVAEALAMVRSALDRFASIAMADLLPPAQTRDGLVAVFLAILELVRRGQAEVTQDDHFAEIRLGRRSVPPAGEAE